MSHPLRECLVRQHQTAWSLASYHLQDLTQDECLWRPAQVGLHVSRTREGRWQADWPDHEGYDLGPPSIAWLTWHMIFWWSMVLDHTWGSARLGRDQIEWPGEASAVRGSIDALREDWSRRIQDLTDSDLCSTDRTRWPFQNRPLGDVLAWVNVELMKNASEIGYARFLYAVRDRKTAG